ETGADPGRCHGQQCGQHGAADDDPLRVVDAGEDLERRDHGVEVLLDGLQRGALAAFGGGGDRVHRGRDVVPGDLRPRGGGAFDHASRIGEQVQAAVPPAAADLDGEAGGQVPDLTGLGAAAAVHAAVGADRGAHAVAEVEVQHGLLGRQVTGPDLAGQGRVGVLVEED